MNAFEKQNIHFAYNKSIITAQVKVILSKKVSFLKDHPDGTIRIEGNIDKRE